jgi:hypothetical protein
LIAVLIAGALIDIVRGGDLVKCEPQRVTGDGRHWAYRIVDGRECWYPGRPGKPKNELSGTAHSRRPKEASRRPGLWPYYRSGSMRYGGFPSQDEDHGQFVPEMLAD